MHLTFVMIWIFVGSLHQAGSVNIVEVYVVLVSQVSNYSNKTIQSTHIRTYNRYRAKVKVANQSKKVNIELI